MTKKVQMPIEADKVSTLQSNLEPQDIFLTEDTLAKRWDCSKKLLQKKRADGGFVPFCKISNCVRYRLSEVLAYEAANTKTNNCNQ